MLRSETGQKDSTIHEKDKPKKKKKLKEDEPSEPNLTTHRRELAQDDSINPAPFRLKPFQLAHLLDPKDLATLSALGGINGITRGLGTHPENGLTTTTGGNLPQGARLGSSFRRGSGSSQFRRGLPNIILTEPSGQEGNPEGDDNAPYNGTIEDRKRVYGENILPIRASKTLLQLMAAALKDRVLVSKSELPQTSALIIHDQILLSIAAVVSLALGLFQDFGTHRDTSTPPVDWVEGVAIMVAIAIVVSCFHPSLILVFYRLPLGCCWFFKRLAKGASIQGA